MVKAGYFFMRRALGYDTAPAIERGLIETVALSYLRLQCAELAFSSAQDATGQTFSTILFYEKRLGMAQRRYLRSTVELARVRRLLRRDPVLQFNVAEAGSQVVNVAELRGKTKNVG
jgi:hypothetical protein